MGFKWISGFFFRWTSCFLLDPGLTNRHSRSILCVVNRDNRERFAETSSDYEIDCSQCCTNAPKSFLRSVISPFQSIPTVNASHFWRLNEVVREYLPRLFFEIIIQKTLSTTTTKETTRTTTLTDGILCFLSRNDIWWKRVNR